MKILYITTIAGTINAFLVPHIKMLLGCGHSVDVACNNTKTLNTELSELGCGIYQVPFSRTPFSYENILAYKVLKGLSKKNSYDVIHTHTPVASAIARLVFKKSGCRIIYTAHGFHFCEGAELLNWAVYYPTEKWLSKYTDMIITINKEDFEFAKGKLNSREVIHIPGVGIDLNMFNLEGNENEVEKRDIGIPEDAKLILSVGELSKRKNHSVVIEALKIIGNYDLHYVICGEGNLHETLIKMADELGLAEQVHLLGFRSDVRKIFPLADLFVFPSKREGLPVALLEALLAGVPIIGSNIRGNVDLSNLGLPIKLLETMDPKSLAKEITRWLDGELFSGFSGDPKEALKPFAIEEIEHHLKKIYSCES